MAEKQEPFNNADSEKADGQQDESLVEVFRVTNNPDTFLDNVGRAEHFFLKASDGSISCVIHNREAKQCVAPLKNSLIWQSNLDGKTYKVTVTRIGPYKGRLVLTRGDVVILSQGVSLMYNAEYGPDLEDIQSWQSTCLAAADDDYRRRGKQPP